MVWLLCSLRAPTSTSLVFRTVLIVSVLQHRKMFMALNTHVHLKQSLQYIASEKRKVSQQKLQTLCSSFKPTLMNRHTLLCFVPAALSGQTAVEQNLSGLAGDKMISRSDGSKSHWGLF